MNSGPAGGDVKQDAGERMGSVGEGGALVGRDDGRWVGVAGGDGGESGGGEGGAKFGVEGEGYVFFRYVVGKLSSGVRASVCGIEEDDVAVGLGVEDGTCCEEQCGSECDGEAVGHRG